MTNPGDTIVRPDSSPADSPGAPVAIRMTDISKAFGGVKALDGVGIEVRRGEVHALLGGNGAGKSTLLKILRGIQPPDGGTIEIDGKPLTTHTPEESRKAGIAMIFQEMSLVPALTVAQNIFLNREPRAHFGLIDDNACIRRARELFEEFQVDINPAAAVADLSAGQRQLTEIVKAMSQRTSILVLDEPTSALTETEVNLLFAMLRRLSAAGVAIIYVSHRMDEIMRIASRATILRDGRHVTTVNLAETTIEEIIQHVVGRQGRNLTVPLGETDHALGEPILELKGVSGEHKPIDVNLVVRRGEVVGIAGLLGSGRSSLARTLFGMTPLRSGEIRVKGQPVHLRSAEDAIAAGIALIPEDRLKEGLVVQHSVANNIALPVLDRLSHRYWLAPRRVDQLAGEQISAMRIKTHSSDTLAIALSGGNQQKIVLAKWLATDPDILILDEPTAGIDIGSKTEIVALIREMARRGKAVILISSELPELLAASDRIVVMADGRAKREVPSSDLVVAASLEEDPVERLQEAQRRLQILIQKVNSNE